jgi:hypothetical protein
MFSAVNSFVPDVGAKNIECHVLTPFNFKNWVLLHIDCSGTFVCQVPASKPWKLGYCAVRSDRSSLHPTN